MKVVITNEAKSDLIEIADNPFAFPLVQRYKHLEIRRCVHRDYLIFYRVLNNNIEVIHILHGAQDYDISIVA